jgi:hypothetical protein
LRSHFAEVKKAAGAAAGWPKRKARLAVWISAKQRGDSTQEISASLRGGSGGSSSSASGAGVVAAVHVPAGGSGGSTEYQ